MRTTGNSRCAVNPARVPADLVYYGQYYTKLAYEHTHYVIVSFENVAESLSRAVDIVDTRASRASRVGQ